MSNTKKNNYKNKSVLLSSDCTKNTKLPREFNKIINSKFKHLDFIKISVLFTAKLGLKNKNRSYEDIKNKAIELFRKQEKKLNIQKDYKVQFVDCSYKKNLNSCINSIKTSNVVWVMGGDTFYLWYHLKNSKINNLICNKIKKKEILYVGCCAGAIVAGESINPTYIARFYKKSYKYNLNNIYKPDFWNKLKNKKTFKLIKNKDFLPHCRTKKSRVLNMYKHKTKMFCLPEYKPFIK
tara:strand:- start:379 stop:1089 length:711 start_codon:yes stop_codon:yes gene_type:complete